MKWTKTLIQTLRDNPQDAEIDSHKLLVRAGIVKKLAGGLYTYLPLGMRSLKKVQSIVRDEMDKADGQEVMFPVAMPATLWEESGRYDSIGSELLRFKDRSGADMVLGMTHEEASVHFVRDVADSYTMGSSCLIEARKTDHPCTFIPPQWAYTYPDDESMYLKNHDIIGTGVNFWWIELGGEDAKIIFFGGALEERMNGSCAGGTGAFIDQMASLLETDAPGLNELAKGATHIYPIASRCGVFAKTDIQALMNDGAEKAERLAYRTLNKVYKKVGLVPRKRG